VATSVGRVAIAGVATVAGAGWLFARSGLDRALDLASRDRRCDGS
jgi:hypothetical protein